MAQGSKGASRHTPSAPSAPNGPSTPSSASAVSSGPTVNRKKQKRRQKQAAKLAATQDQPPAPSDPPQQFHSPQNAPHYQEFDDDDSEYGYGTYADGSDQVNGHASGDPSDAAKKKSKKKKGKPAPDHYPLASSVQPGPDNVWDTSKREESKRIKEFWVSLTDDERKSLLVLEKNAVLKTMRESSQKQTCSCTVCGRRRNAIEEELESLYEQYFTDLQQYAFADYDPVNSGSQFPYSNAMDQRISRNPDGIPPLHSHTHGRDEGYDEEDEDDDLEEYSDDAYDAPLNQHQASSVRRATNEMYHLGNSLAVKDGILTVADDLLKNEGKRFIEMMEQLAERRLAREEEAQYAAHHVPHDNAYTSHEDHLEDDENLDEDEYVEDEENEDDEDEEEARATVDARATADQYQDAMSENQRAEEGKKMFHLFAARMFEQRVFAAYRAKVANDRQQRLLEELEEEKTNDVQREAKKQRDAQKKKEKKLHQKQAKAEEKARKEAEKKAEEDAAKAEEARKQDELRKKKEEQRKKKDAERKAQEEERMRKEAERLRKLQEERDRQQEAERKAREQKALEKKAKDDLRRKEREEKEAKERDVKEKKAQAEKLRREKEEKAKAEKDAERSRREAREAAAAREARDARDAQVQAAQAREAAQAQQAIHARRTGSAAPPVAVPGLSRNPSSFSPHVAVATPAIPKAPTPVRVRPGSQQGSKGSSPRTPHVSAGSGKSTSPAETVPQHATTRKPTMPKIPPAPIPSAPVHSIAPPPGMLPSLFNSQPQNGYQPGVMPIRGPPMFPLQAQAGASQYRPQQIPPPPPGLPSMNRILSEPPGLLPQSGPPGIALGQPQHARQASGSSQYEFGAQPIQRPMGRSSSTKPEDGMDELSTQLGSSALLDDLDEPLLGDHRRPPPGLPRGSTFGASPIFSQPGQLGPGSSNTSSAWGTPPSTLPFSQPGVATISPVGPAGTSWSSPSSGWGSAGLPSLPSSKASGFPISSGRPRPLTIRMHAANVFKHLIGNKIMAADSWQELGTLLRHMDQCVAPPVSPQELLDICDTEGNEHNGGGEFLVRVPQGAAGIESMLVRYVFADPHRLDKEVLAGAGKAIGAGDIGSPAVGVASAVAAPGPPPGLFPGLGGHHAAGFH